MNSFWSFVEDVASGFVSAATGRTPVNPAGTTVEECCRQLGWTIDERPTASEMRLYFKDPLVRRRRVVLTFGDQGIYALFRVCSAVWIPTKQVPFAALGYLLERNGEPFVGWELCVGDDDDVGFAVSYLAIAVGLQPAIFKLICETMVKEAYEFDARMDKAGLLR